MPEGNRLLIDSGGIALDPGVLDQRSALRAWLNVQSTAWDEAVRDEAPGRAHGEEVPKQLPLFDEPG